MAFQTPITVKEAVENINAKKYLLPVIQREVVWGVDQITLLFDSLMRDYPIGSLLFWHVERKNALKYQFYEFVRQYHQIKMAHNPKADVRGNNDIIGVIDGQQRLTSLYIGLKGTYASKMPWKRWANVDAFPARSLYLNLLAPAPNPDADETLPIYDFRFLTEEDVKTGEGKAFWFRVGDILDLKEQVQVNEYLAKEGLLERPKDQLMFANRTLFKLWEVVHQRQAINFFLENDESLSRVLNIFVRANKGGTPLNYSDLFLSIASAQWQKRDARDVIISFVDELNGIGNGFNIDKDIVLKSCLVLADLANIAWKVENFNKGNTRKIEDEWDDIASALRLAVSLVSALGYNGDTLTANNAIIPIAYYLKRIGLPKGFEVTTRYAKDREAIRRWLILSLVKRVFGGTPDVVLRPIRECLQDCGDGFPLQRIIAKFKGTSKAIVCTADDVESMLDYDYRRGYAFSVLALLYPTLNFRNNLHIDHLHPQAKFRLSMLRKMGVPEADINFCLENADAVPNLELLEGLANQEKRDSDFGAWFHKTCGSREAGTAYRQLHYIPDTDLALKGFREFFKARKALMRARLRQTLGVQDHDSGNG